jgi:uncharacterized protein with HEPN domain
MRDATEQAIAFCATRDRSDLDSDPMLLLALTRLLEIIGEAAKFVSDSTRALAPAVPWRQAAGTRDRIAHGYYDINLDVVWEIVSNDLPVLRNELNELLTRLG